MNQQSAFQLQYPLSPKKFWKKTIPNFISYFFVFIVLGGFVGLSIFVVKSSSDASGFEFFSWIFGGVVVFLLIYTTYIVLYSWYIKVFIRRYYYDCGEQFITIKKGVFTPTEIHVQYQKIQDVYVDQDIWDRILGLYDVHIASATITSGIEAHIDGVNFDVAEALKNIILAKINGVNNSPFSSTNIERPKQQEINSGPIQLNQRISSETYPISWKWVFSAISGSARSSFFIIFMYFLVIFGDKKGDILFSMNHFLFILLIFGILFFSNLFWKALWKINFYFEFTPDFILLRTGVISRSETHLPYKAIQNVLTYQSIFDRIFGLSNLIIQNAATSFVPVGKGRMMPQSSSLSLVWQPKEKAEELNVIIKDILNKISPQSSSSTGL